jgi:hypothetical protein
MKDVEERFHCSALLTRVIRVGRPCAQFPSSHRRLQPGCIVIADFTGEPQPRWKEEEKKQQVGWEKSASRKKPDGFVRAKRTENHSATNAIRQRIKLDGEVPLAAFTAFTYHSIRSTRSIINFRSLRRVLAGLRSVRVHSLAGVRGWI